MLDAAAEKGAQAALARLGTHADLGNCTAHLQDTPLQEEDAMANRLQQRIETGIDELGKPIIKVAHGHNQQELMVNCAKILVGAGLIGDAQHAKQHEKSIPLFGEAQSTKHQDKGVPLFGEYLMDFHKAFKKKLAPTTKETYRQMIQKHILPRWGNIPLNKIKTAMVQELFDDMADAGLSLETIKKIRNIIRPIFVYAVEEGYISINPVISPHLRINTDKGGGHVALPSDKIAEIKHGLHAMPDDLRRLLALLAYTGQRIGEVLGLRWEDVDYENKVIHIVRGVTHPDRNKPIVGKPKTKASQRDIPLIQPLLDAIGPIQKEGYIVSGDRPWSFSEERRRWVKIQKHFGIEGYTHHDFRDTCATDWLEAGIPLEVVSKLLGHRSISTTAKHYMRIRDHTIQNAGRVMEQMGTNPFASEFASA